MKLTWDESILANSYDVYMKGYEEDATWKRVDTVTDTTLTVKIDKTGKQYSFYVIAKNNSGKASKSSTVKCATSLHGKVTLSMTQVSDTKFKLSWNKITGATRYIVYRKRNQDTYKKVLTLAGNVFEYTTAEMPNGKYSFIMKAAIYDGKDRIMTAGSNAKSGTVDKPKPVLTLTAGTKQIKVSWKKLEGVTNYNIYRATSSTGTYKKLATTTSLSYTSKSLTSGKKYYFKVQGYKTYKSGTEIQYKVYTDYSSVKSATAK